MRATCLDVAGADSVAPAPPVVMAMQAPAPRPSIPTFNGLNVMVSPQICERDWLITECHRAE
ncbi:hypothetical protein GCM10022214_04410 [Actinomadura miaoliensis]|uniref:Uncharacterized protein n=1 Tax=Actinomadura miaoliensis TaxID=430685 RepID=A0ABP7UZ55_9ACTN